MKNNTNKKVDSIYKTSILISIIVVFGKVIGFIRDAVIAGFYGATEKTDAFFLAQSMPSMIFPAICSSISTAFVSLYVSRSVENGHQDGERFASRMLIASLIISLGLSVFAVILAPLYVPIFAPGFSEYQRILAIKLTRLTMGSFALTMATYMLSAILNSKKMFYGSQIAGVGYNISVIFITLMLGSGQSMEALTLTVILGHLIQVIILIGLVWRNFDFTLNINPFNSDTSYLIKLALPILLGNSIVQINNIVDKFLASYLDGGAVSALSYSSSLNRFVTGVFITSLSTVLYPSFTRSLAKNNIQKFNKELQNSLIILPMIILPISIITIIGSKDIVSIIYQRGSFDQSASDLTSTALKFYAGMYVFSSIQEVIIRAFYALKDTKTPMKNAIIAVFANSIFSIILVRYIGIGGIALGTTISTALASGMLWFSLKRKLVNVNFSSLSSKLIKLIIASVLSFVWILLIHNRLYYLTDLNRFILVSISGFVSYFMILYILKLEEVYRIKRSIFNKIDSL